MTATLATTTKLKLYLGIASTDTTFSDTTLQDALDRAEVEIESRTYTTFVDGTGATPDYRQVLNEKHRGKGYNQLNYNTKHYPLPDVSTTVSGTAVTADDTTVYVASTSGFPSSGSILIEDDKIEYTAKTTTSFTGCTSVSAHATAKTVTPFVIEISTTADGQTPSWTVLEADDDYDLDLQSGRVRLFESTIDVSNTTSISRFPAYDVPNRFRVSYIHGWDSIPADIERLCLMIASKDLMHSAVRKAHIHGRDGFDPSLIDVDEKWINDTINKYKSERYTYV